MKKLLYIVSLVCILASCASHRLTNAEKYPALSKMIKGYYHRYFEYPQCADELINFANVYEDYWRLETAKDSIETTLNNLHKEKEKLLWKRNATYPWEETDLAIISNNDTILEESYPLDDVVNENGLVVKSGRFFSAQEWDYLMEFYVKDYFKFPNSIIDFVEYSGLQDLIDIDTLPIDRSNEGMGLFGFVGNRCSAAVFRYFLNHQEDVVWHSEDTSLLIIIDADTVFYNFIDSDFPCHTYDNHPGERVLYNPKFYDLEGHVTYLDDFLTSEFRNKTHGYFRIIYPFEVDTNYYNNFHFLQYTQSEGLAVLCKDDDMNPNTEYFTHLERYVKTFAEKNKFGKIVFVAPNLKDTRINERNIMRIFVDGNNTILVNRKEIQLEKLKDMVKYFSTPHPDDDTAPEVEWKTLDLIGSIQFSKGIIFYDADRNAKYAKYLDVQKEILQAFDEMRQEMSIKVFNKPYDQLDEEQTKNINNAVPKRIFEEL